MKTPWQLHLIGILVIIFTLSAEATYLFHGTAANIPDVLLGRVLGTFDTCLALVLGYYFTASIRQSPARQNDHPEPPPQPQPPKGTS